MSSSAVHNWTVTDAERAEFARFSGDHNPIHDDPVAARRLHGGRLLAHGAHLLLSVIDQAIVAGHLTTTPRSVTVAFLHGVEPGMPLTTSFELDDGAVRARGTADIWPAADIVMHTGDARPTSFVDAPPLEGADERPHEHEFTELAGLSGSVTLAALVDHGTAFAHVTDILGDVRVAEIAAISRVVGMRAPGLYSMSAKYEIEFSQAADVIEPRELEYRVEAADSRMRRVRLGLSGPTMTATVTAFSLEPWPTYSRCRTT